MATLNLSLLPKTLRTPLSTSTLPLAAAPSRSATTVHLNPTTARGSLVLLRAAIDGNRTAKQRSSGSNEPGDTIMLPGCDFNHWLIIMEFPQDPAPTRDQMIQTYLDTLATVVGRETFALKGILDEAIEFALSMSIRGPWGSPVVIPEVSAIPIPIANDLLNERLCNIREMKIEGPFLQFHLQSVVPERAQKHLSLMRYLCTTEPIVSCVLSNLTKGQLRTEQRKEQSMEEAKKNMYAFSTTTYTGFQCTVSEETSEKFKGLPGVLWVLPDSYIDVKNEDYGGDKYIDGEIIPSTYPTHQPNQSKSRSKYESKKFVRKRDGSAADQGKPRREANSSESTP
ncbi:hypothetical protein RHSIM_Rhsim13G0163700 [Rhododendron simsii]|uniref:MORF/ORRM1/DAG-like MORF domain-containing protein n=1 Tax=Rhododendron simsii TaxID=118357 RepID=A0A834G091_RHOSS|nr:hypothetical protein RHSIM_Rhsim13G0163700 [Rhododendron simsii]